MRVRLPPSAPLTNQSRNTEQNRFRTFLLIAFAISIFITLSPFILLFLLFHFLKGKWISFLVRQKWYPKGKFLLFVYSDSPNWKNYIERVLLPYISNKAVVINWTERSEWEWKHTLELKIFEHWTGVVQYFERGRKKWDGSEFNPVAIVFVPWYKPKVIRFWQAFKDYKHGKELKLKKCEEELFRVLGVKRTP